MIAPNSNVYMLPSVQNNQVVGGVNQLVNVVLRKQAHTGTSTPVGIIYQADLIQAGIYLKELLSITAVSKTDTTNAISNSHFTSALSPVKCLSIETISQLPTTGGVPDAIYAHCTEDNNFYLSSGSPNTVWTKTAIETVQTALGVYTWAGTATGDPVAGDITLLITGIWG